MKNSQQGFALVESMIAGVIFAILLIALLNYSQYIALNFNQISQSAKAVRSLHGTLEKTVSSHNAIPLKVEPWAHDLQNREQQIEIVYSANVGSCAESKVSLSAGNKRHSISRWQCAKGESHVSGLSF